MREAVELFLPHTAANDHQPDLAVFDCDALPPRSKEA